MDLTPISPKVVLQTLRSVYQFPALVKSLADIGINKDEFSLLALCQKPNSLPIRGGFGFSWYRVI